MKNDVAHLNSEEQLLLTIFNQSLQLIENLFVGVMLFGVTIFSLLVLFVLIVMLYLYDCHVCIILY